MVNGKTGLLEYFHFFKVIIFYDYSVIRVYYEEFYYKAIIIILYSIPYIFQVLI